MRNLLSLQQNCRAKIETIKWFGAIKEDYLKSAGIKQTNFHIGAHLGIRFIIGIIQHISARIQLSRIFVYPLPYRCVVQSSTVLNMLSSLFTKMSWTFLVFVIFIEQFSITDLNLSVRPF